MIFNASQRIKLFDDDRTLLSQEYRDRWLLETAKRRKVNESMADLFEKNMPKKKKKTLLGLIPLP